jgi:hypothetical protein
VADDKKESRKLWYWWIATQYSFYPLYFVKHYVFTSVYYFVLLIMAVWGLLEWMKRQNILMLKKIVIIGTEFNREKATLCEQLAMHYKNLVVP